MTKKPPLRRKEFARELKKVIAGDPTASKDVGRFWNDMCETNGIRVATELRDGIEVLRERTTP